MNHTEVLDELGITEVFNVGYKRGAEALPGFEGTVFSVGITDTGWAERDIAERRVKAYNVERGFVVTGEGPYVVISRFTSEWREI